MKKRSSAGLFEESSGESQDEDEDQDRFKLRPEFEGSAGKKVNLSNGTCRYDPSFQTKKV